VKILAVIPALNSSEFLPALLPKVGEKVDDILVIDDGSSDNTTAIAADLGAVVIRHETNRGKGGALKTGFAYAVENDFDIVIALDSDGQHDPEFIPAFIERFSSSHADLIIGSRVKAKGDMPWPRRFSNWSTSRFLSFILKTNIEDAQCGYRLISRKLIESIILESDRFELESEIIIKAARAGFKIEFVPILRHSNPKRYAPVRRYLALVPIGHEIIKINSLRYPEIRG